MLLTISLTSYQLFNFIEYINKCKSKNGKVTEFNNMVDVFNGSSDINYDVGSITLQKFETVAEDKFKPVCELTYNGPRSKIPYELFRHMAGQSHLQGKDFKDIASLFTVVEHQSMFSGMNWYEQHREYLLSDRSTLEDWEKLDRLRPDSPLLLESNFCIKFCNHLDVKDILYGHNPSFMYLGRYHQSIMAQRVVMLTRKHYPGNTEDYENWMYNNLKVKPSEFQDLGVLEYIALIVGIIVVLMLFIR